MKHVLWLGATALAPVVGRVGPGWFFTRVRQYAVNALLTVISIAFTYLIIELVYFRVLLPYTSANIRTHLPDAAGVLVQNSKAQFLPRNYVALLGDSYAEGIGDWL